MTYAVFRHSQKILQSRVVTKECVGALRQIQPMQNNVLVKNVLCLFDFV